MPKTPQLAKLTRPRSAGLLKRERLFHALDKARAAHAVIWVAAQPGAGKTSLVASYLDARKLKGIWYQCDAGDHDLASFFYYMGLALTQATPRKQPFSMLLTPEYLPNLPVFVRRYFRELAARLPQPFAIVLDNYQDGATEGLNSALDIACDELPAGSHLIVVSRSGPPGELARHAANQRLTLLDAKALRLALEETSALMHGEPKTADQATQAIQQQTDGWAAGVVLLREHLRRADGDPTKFPASSPRSIFDYFAGQILARLDADARNFLLRTALLPNMTAALAAEVSEVADAGERLEYLAKNHVFTDLRDGTEQSYQYHPLFRDFLRARLAQACSLAELHALTERSARLLEAGGMIDEAAELYVQVEAWQELVRLTLQNAESLLAQGRWRTVVNWAQRFPEELLDTQPWLLFWAGKALIPIDQAGARKKLERAYLRFKSSNDNTGQIVSICGVVWTHYFEAFATESMDRWIDPLENLLSTADEFNSPSINLAAYSAFQLVTMWVKPSHPMLHPCALRLMELLDMELDATERVSAAAFALQYFDLVGRFELSALVIEKIDRLITAGDISPVSLVSWLTNRGYHFYITVRYDEAMHTLDRAVAIARANGLAQGEFSAQAFRAFAAVVEGDATKALEAIESQAKLLQPSWHVSVAQHHMSWALLEQLRRNWAKAAHHTHLHLTAARETTAPFFLIVWGSCGAGALALAGLHDDARSIVDEVRAMRTGTCYTCYDGLLYLDESYTHYLQGNHLEAQALLREALIWAKTNNLPHFFRWLVGGLSTLLAYALAENVEADYARELASAWRVKPPSRDTPGWPWPVKLHTLGRFAIELDDQPIIFGRKTPKKDLALLKLLTAAGSKGWPEAKIKDELWPDLDGDRAGNSLKQSLHRLRDLLKDHDAIESKDGSLALNRQRVWCDAWAFDAFSSKQLALNGDAEVLRKQGQRLLALYPGNFLDDDAELPFLVSARERLRAAFVEQVSQIARHLEQAGEFADTLELFRKALEVDSNIEAFYQGAMRCQLKLGRFAEGLAVYERLRRVLLSQWKTEPSMASKALAERLHAGEPLI